jgi:hypothetical protein
MATLATPEASEPDMLRAALWYAKHGIPVFPCVPRTKRPLTPHGFKDASRDPDVVRAWWRQNPDSNVAIPTGRAIGAWVLDCDCKAGARGLETYERLSSEPAVRETLQQVTGSGGKHLFFALPGFDVPSFDQRSTAKVGLDGCDIKAEGGYVVVPPSIHPDTGRAYAWDGLQPFIEQRILEAPPELLEALARLIDAPAKQQNARALAPIPEGQRNDTLFRLACSLRSKGLSEAAIRTELIEQNRARCQPPLPGGEVEKIASSAGKYPAGDTVPLIAEVRIEDPSIEDLNRLAVWGTRIAFSTVRRRGQAIEAVTRTGRCVRWRTMAEVGSFAKAQQAIAAGAGVWLPTPPRNKIRAWWDAAASLLIALSEKDCTMAGDPTVLEAETLLRETWESLGCPRADESIRMGDFIAELKQYQRLKPNGLTVGAPVVFLAEGAAWVHPGKWRIWLGTPQGMNRHYPMADLLDLLSALDFRQAEDVTRRTSSGETVKANLWVGEPGWLTGVTGVTGP